MLQHPPQELGEAQDGVEALLSPAKAEGEVISSSRLLTHGPREGRSLSRSPSSETTEVPPGSVFCRV